MISADKIKSKAGSFTLAGLAAFERQEETVSLKPGGVRQITPSKWIPAHRRHSQTHSLIPTRKLRAHLRKHGLIFNPYLQKRICVKD